MAAPESESAIKKKKLLHGSHEIKIDVVHFELRQLLLQSGANVFYLLGHLRAKINDPKPDRT